MAKRLIVSRNAYRDIDRIVEFNDVRNKSTTYSKKFVKSLSKEFKRLTKLPFMGIETEQEGMLLLVWDNYYIYYSITETVIEIRAIYHQREDAR